MSSYDWLKPVNDMQIVNDLPIYIFVFNVVVVVVAVFVNCAGRTV